MGFGFELLGVLSSGNQSIQSNKRAMLKKHNWMVNTMISTFVLLQNVQEPAISIWIGKCWCLAMLLWATTHLTLSSPLFTFNLSLCTPAHPLEALYPPLSGCHGYPTQCSVSSSCCDQRASRFHRHWIFQPAQLGGVHVLREWERWCPCLTRLHCVYITEGVASQGTGSGWSSVMAHLKLEQCSE